MTEKFLQNNNLHNSDDIDALLELASLVRELINQKLYSDFNRIINYTIENNYTEAFSWTIAILQEEFEKEEAELEDFHCLIGGQITHYDELIEILQVDFKSIKNYIEKIYDKHGEPEAFFNVMIYKTCYENIFFVSTENFDNKDNDYIRYKISFVKDKNIYL